MTRNDNGKFESERELRQYKKLYQQYSEWLMINVNKERTITRRKAGAEAWLAWCESNDCDPIYALSSDVRSFIKSMQVDGLADTTICNRFASVSKFFHYIKTDPDRPANENTKNPTAEINLRKDHDITNTAQYTSIIHREGREDIIAPPYEKLKPIFDYVPGSTGFSKVRNELICRLFWQTALRSDELSRVRIQKVDTDKRQIKIRSAKLNREDHPDLYQRYVFYESSLDYLIHRWLDKRAAKEGDKDSPHLLIGQHGGQLNPSYLSRIVKKAAHNAGIQEPLVKDEDGSVQRWLYTAHRLRHSRITQLANKTDMDLNFIRMTAGHASMDTTLEYVDPDWDEARTAFKKATDE